jgi:branched-chain amino acid transport system substrate-binding protein
MRLMKVAVLVLAAAACSIGCKKQNSGTGDIVIGEFASLTGGTATFGTSSHDGLTMAVDEANSAGGVLGRKIKIVTADDASDVTQAGTAVQKLINQDGAVAIIGEVASKRSIAGAGICTKYKIPMLSPASTNPGVTMLDGQVRPWIFRICFTDDFQGSANARWAVDKGWKSIAIMTDNDEDYSKGLARSFKEAFESHGTIIKDVTYRNSDRDFQSQLKLIADAKPDAIYVPGYYTEIGMITNQAAGMGLKVPFFGGDGWDSPETLKADSTQGDFYSDHFTAQDPNPQVQDFVKSYSAKYGKSPDSMTVLGYDAGKVMIDAIKRAGSAEPDAIRAALAATVYTGVSGKITIDEHHNARKPIVILEIKDHKAVLAKRYEP